MLLSCLLIIWKLYCLWMPTMTRQRGYGVNSVRDSEFVLNFHIWWHQTGEHYQSIQDCTRLLWTWKCHGLGRDHHDWEDRTPHLMRECHWALLQHHWAYCCALRPLAQECTHLSWWQCKRPLCTCCPRSPAVSAVFCCCFFFCVCVCVVVVDLFCFLFC